MPNIITDENYLPLGYVLAKRINYEDYDEDSFLSIIKEQCIDNGQPLVVSNMNKSSGWNQQVFTLEQLKKYRGNEVLSFIPKGRQDQKTEKLGDYIKTLQQDYKLNALDQFEKTKKGRSLPRKQRTPEMITDEAPTPHHEQTSANEQHGNDVENHTETGDQQVLLSKILNKVKNEPEAPSIVELEVPPIKFKPEAPTSCEYKELKYSIAKVYAKDIDCPAEYVESMHQILPEYLLPHGSNDLFSLLPDRFKATNLMCYLGQDSTGTPIHRDLCGTMGHNIMTMSSPDALSEWCIVVNKDREKLAEIIKPTTRENKKIHRFDYDTAKRANSVTKSCFMESDRAWLDFSKATRSNLDVQVILQRIGDMVIVPSRAYHQVRNKGVSVKIAWNRITAQALDCAFEDQLPLYRIINRPEVYKCKAIICFTLKEWSSQLSNLSNSNVQNIYNLPVLKYGRDAFIEDSQKILRLYFDILSQEILSDEDSKDVTSDLPGEYFTVKCDFCHSDVFYRYFHCTQCNEYDLCMNCYNIGRSCKHVNNMKMQQGPDTLDSLVNIYKDFIQNGNRIFDEKIFIDKSNELSQDNITLSLATLCRRIEGYRRMKQNKLNTFTCIHCLEDSTASVLAENGISLTSIFKRTRCPKAHKHMDPEDIFVCKQCTLQCDVCEPLEESNESMADYDLVYYAPPVVDERNWGAFFDFDINKACDYPKRTNSSSPSPEPKPRQKSKNNAAARNASKTLEVETKPILYTRSTRSRKFVINSEEENTKESDQEDGQDSAQESGQENEDDIEDEYIESNSEEEDYYYVAKLDARDGDCVEKNNDDSADEYIEEKRNVSIKNIPIPSKNTRKRKPDNDLAKENTTRRKKNIRTRSLSQPATINTRKRKQATDENKEITKPAKVTRSNSSQSTQLCPPPFFPAYHHIDPGLNNPLKNVDFAGVVRSPLSNHLYQAQSPSSSPSPASAIPPDSYVTDLENPAQFNEQLVGAARKLTKVVPANLPSVSRRKDKNV